MEKGKNCYITAPYTDGSTFGYVFDGCKIVGSPTDKFDFGRSWGGTAMCAFLNTILDENAAKNISSTRWSTGGMNVVAKNFWEYNTLNEAGKVISPAENTVKFTKDKEVNEYNTIMTSEKAAGYALDKVFTDWAPAELAAQKAGTTPVVANNQLSWNGDAQMYLVEKEGEFFAMTTEKILSIDDTNSKYAVRAANEMGGFGEPSSITTGISQLPSSIVEKTVSTTIYSVDGAQLSAPQKGVNIVVKTLADGSKKTSKVIVK